MSAWAVRQPVTPVVLFVVLSFLGTVAFLRLPINEMPDISFPYVTVGISQPGAAPPEIETQILQKVEGAVASIGGVKHIESTALEGQATIGIEFQIGTPVDRAVADVRDAVAKIRSDLPEGIEEPIVQRIDVDGGAIVFYAVSTTSMTEEELSWFVDNTITKRLLGLAGVAQVTRGGGVSREIRIELDPGSMQALGLTAVDVNAQMRSLNLDAPGGRAQVAGGEQGIRVLGGAKTAAQLADTQIMLPGARFARLSDIANVHDGVSEIRSLSRLNGRPATTFSVFRSKGSSDVTVLEDIHEEIASVAQQFPEVKLNQVFTTVDSTKRGYDAALTTLIEGSILAVLVVWLFLRDRHATAIAALAIPLSAIPTFAFMYWVGFTLNGISLLALTLVAGVLVDDAIVEIENIVRHMRMGKTAYQAALDAADEIGLAVVATSATIIAVFLPVSFMSGLVGQYFRQFGLTVAAAVFFSLLVARLITPVLAAFFLRADSLKVHADGAIMNWYMDFVSKCIRNRWRTIAGGAVFFALSVVALTFIPQSLLPDEDSSHSQLLIEMPPGVRLEDTAAASDAAYQIISKYPEVTSVIEQIGGGEGDEVRNATLHVALVPLEKRRLSQAEWERMVILELKRIPDARISFQRVSAAGEGRDVTLYVTSDDARLVEETAQKLVNEMRTLPSLREPLINGDRQRPEIIIRPRFDLAAQMGVTVQSISQTIRLATLGDLPQNGAKFSLPDRQVPIRVSLVEHARRDLSTIENLPVPTGTGSTVPLKAVADVSFGQGPTRVRRYDQSRRVAVEADLNGVELGDALKQIHALPTAKNVPQGVKIIERGDAEAMDELSSGFAVAMSTGILMMFAVLVLLFARVFQPITILSALPLAIGGAAIALLLTNNPFSLPVVIGFLMLMGIVAKNSILLVDFAIEEMRAGKDRLAALLEAGHKRARPIMMTTVAMIAGMVPALLGLHGDSSFRAPMAIAVIGGLLTSTCLTLIIVPAAFTVIDDLEQWCARKWGARATHVATTVTAGPAEPYRAG